MGASDGDRPSLASERLGNYQTLLELASGGMGTVYVAHQAGAAGFERLVVIKRVHRHLVKDPAFRDMILDEARLASQIRHANVVPVDDVVEARGELLLVQPYIESVPLSTLLAAAAKRGERLPAPVAARIAADALAGLAGAHDAVDLRGQRLEIVHRDVSPQNVVVGTDGASRIIDFGIAKASRRITVTSSGVLKGKLAYMAPEQLRQQPVDARADLFAAGVVLYEALTGARPFDGGDEADTLLSILIGDPAPPSTRADGVPAELDAVVAKLLAHDRAERFATAAEAHDALVAALPLASTREVAAVVERLAGDELAARREDVQRALHLSPYDRPTVEVGAPAAPRPDGATPVELAKTRLEPRPRAARARRPGAVVLAAAAVVAAIAGLGLLTLRGPRAEPGGATTIASAPPSPSAAPSASPSPSLPASASASPSAEATAPSAEHAAARASADHPARTPARPRATASTELHENPYAPAAPPRR
jgi:serine/threonine-protein kinase